MAKQIIQVGTIANDKTGDPLRSAFTKINQNFTELYDGMGAANTGAITFDSVAIIGDTSMMPQGSIELVPNAGAIPAGQTHEGDLYTSWGQYVKIYPTWNADAPHIHITAGSGTNSDGDLFIGDDWKYFQVNHDNSLKIGTGGNEWIFLPDGTVTLPNNTLDGGTSSVDIKSSNYAELQYQGVTAEWQADPSRNSESYVWTAYDGTYIQNVRSADGTNPDWNYTWSFTNQGRLQLPNGGTLGPEGMGWPGFSNGTTELPVSVAYKTNTNNWQSAISFFGGNDADGQGTISLYTYNASTARSYSWEFGANGDTVVAGAIKGSVGSNDYVDTLIELDLTATINKLVPVVNTTQAPHYHLADGTEGQIMYITCATGGATANEYTALQVAHARSTDGLGNIYVTTDNWWLPFKGPNPATTLTLIFIDGAWNLPHNYFD